MDGQNDENQLLAHVLTRFLEQKCVRNIEYSIDDDDIFSSFRTFWLQAPEYIDHPALLGQFRVELVQRGYHAKAGGKCPRWIGLTLQAYLP